MFLLLIKCSQLEFDWCKSCICLSRICRRLPHRNWALNGAGHFLSSYLYCHDFVRVLPTIVSNHMHNHNSRMPGHKYVAQLNFKSCHNPNDNTAQHNLNTGVGLDTRMTVQASPPPNPPHHRYLMIAFRSLRITFIDQN